MKRWMALVIVAALAVSSAGCSSEWGKKFIRKNKGAQKKPRIVQLQKYQKKPSPELYKKHYVYWRSWQSELLSKLGNNHKKDVRCIDEIVANLKEMQNILVPEWGDKMQKYIDDTMGVRETVLYGELSKFNKDSIYRTLDRVDRGIKRDFCYSRVKDHLKQDLNAEDAEEEGLAPQAAPLEGQAQQAPEAKDEPKQ